LNGEGDADLYLANRLVGATELDSTVTEDSNGEVYLRYHRVVITARDDCILQWRSDRLELFFDADVTLTAAVENGIRVTKSK
jgi:hypothetical protein